jgi:hypothetical protein
VTFLAFYDQLGSAVLAVVAEESGFPAFRAVDGQRKTAVAASHPAGLDWCTTFGASGFERVHFAAHRAHV